MITPRNIPGAGASGEPMPTEQPYDMDGNDWGISSLPIQMGKPDYSSAYLDLQGQDSGWYKTDETFVTGAPGAVGFGAPYPAADGGMGTKSVIPRLWKMGLDAWGSVLGGGSKSQRGMGEDNEGSILLEPPAWVKNSGNVVSVQTVAPGQYADTSYLPSVYVTS